MERGAAIASIIEQNRSPRPVGIDEPRMARRHLGVEQDRFRLARRRVAVQLAHHRARAGQEHVGAGDAVPMRRRGEPERLLHRREAEEARDQRGVPGAEQAELVPGSGHLLGGAVERGLVRCRKHHGSGLEARLPLEPGIGDDPTRGEAGGECGVIAHATPVSRNAAAR
jgi:hypothetical protein